MRGVQVVFVVPLRADYADAVGEAVRELGCQGRKWGRAGYGTCVSALERQGGWEIVAGGLELKGMCWLTVVRFGDHRRGFLGAVSFELLGVGMRGGKSSHLQ